MEVCQRVGVTPVPYSGWSITVDLSLETSFVLFCAIHFKNSTPSGLLKLSFAVSSQMINSSFGRHDAPHTKQGISASEKLEIAVFCFRKYARSFRRPRINRSCLLSVIVGSPAGVVGDFRPYV